MLVYLRLLMVLASSVMLIGCSKLTMENYAKIKMGSEYGEVVKILGKPDKCSEALFVRNCVWGNEQKNITVNFVGDKVVLCTSRNIR
ncbi:MAG TPA: DUF3862 domain-containing protein [Geobacteraceae bacterium]